MSSFVHPTGILPHPHALVGTTVLSAVVMSAESALLYQVAARLTRPRVWQSPIFSDLQPEGARNFTPLSAARDAVDRAPLPGARLYLGGLASHASLSGRAGGRGGALDYLPRSLHHTTVASMFVT